jgi:hypothetical protein
MVFGLRWAGAGIVNAPAHRKPNTINRKPLKEIVRKKTKLLLDSGHHWLVSQHETAFFL